MIQIILEEKSVCGRNRIEKQISPQCNRENEVYQMNREKT